MRIAARVVVLTSGLLVFGAPLAAAEDVTITYKVTNDEGSTAIRHKYISPARRRRGPAPIMASSPTAPER